MSNVSIYEKNWIDLVFEDKNQVYGAYQLRQENPRTSLFAFFGGISLILLLLGSWLVISSFANKPEETIISCPIGPTIRPIELEPRVEPIKPKTPNTQAATPPSTNKFKNYQASKTPDVEIPANNNLPVTPAETPGTGIEMPSIGNEGPAVVVTAPIIDSNSPVSPGELDRLPEYPGGIKKFREYVGDNFEKPNNNDNLESLSVIMSFVIEKDGSMSSIRALRSSDKNMEKEAIRVLKSLKIKWSPGYKDGQKMRTLYTLPIKVAL